MKPSCPAVSATAGQYLHQYLTVINTLRYNVILYFKYSTFMEFVVQKNLKPTPNDSLVKYGLLLDTVSIVTNASLVFTNCHYAFICFCCSVDLL